LILGNDIGVTKMILMTFAILLSRFMGFWRDRSEFDKGGILKSDRTNRTEDRGRRTEREGGKMGREQIPISKSFSSFIKGAIRPFFVG